MISFQCPRVIKFRIFYLKVSKGLCINISLRYKGRNVLNRPLSTLSDEKNFKVLIDFLRSSFEGSLLYWSPGTSILELYIPLTFQISYILVNYRIIYYKLQLYHSHMTKHTTILSQPYDRPINGTI